MPSVNTPPQSGTWTLFVQYPNREPVLREIAAPPRNLPELLKALELWDDQRLLVADRQDKSQLSLVENVGQLFDGALLRVVVNRRCIYVACEGLTGERSVAWYPGAPPEEIEHAIVKACGLPVGTSIELMDGDDALVISATIPDGSRLSVVPINPAPTASNGGGSSAHHAANGASASARRSSGYSTTGATPDRRPDQGERNPYTPTVPFQAGSRNTSPGQRGTSVRAGRCATSAVQLAGGSTSTPAAQSGAGGGSGGGAGSGGGRGETSSGGSAVARSTSRAGSPSSRDLRATSAQELAAQPTGRVSAPDEHCVHILAGHAGFVLSLCTIGDVLFTGSQDCNIMIWDLNNLQYIGTLPGHRGFVKCMCATLPRKLLCSGSQDKTIKVWSLETFSSTKTLCGHSSEVNALAILEGMDVLVSGSEDRTVRVWDLTQLTQITSVDQAHLSSIFALAPLDGGHFLSASRDRTVKVWQASSWTARRTLNPPHYDGVSGLAVGPKTNTFYSVSRDRSIRKWDSRSFESDMQLTHAHGDWLGCVALSPSENVLFSGSKDCVVKVWDSDLHCKDLLLGHRGSISALVTVENHLFSASHDRTVRVWRVDQYEPYSDS